MYTHDNAEGVEDFLCFLNDKCSSVCLKTDGGFESIMCSKVSINCTFTGAFMYFSSQNDNC